jgi:PAS domain-containing protein
MTRGAAVILLIPNAVRAEAEELPPWDILEDHTVNLYRTVIETMKEGIVLQTSNGAIVEANRAAAEILGVSMESTDGPDVHGSPVVHGE